MARRKEEKYLFDASTRQVSIPGHVNTNDMLTIINVTDNIVIQSLEPGKGITNREHFHPLIGTDPNFAWSIDGYCVFTLEYDTTAMDDADELLIFVEDERKGLTIRPYDAAVDGIERMKVSQPETLIDADFEYGLQDSKWQNLGYNNGYPSFSEGIGLPLDLSGGSISSNGASPNSTITVNAPGQALAVGDAVVVKGLQEGKSLAEGAFVVVTSDNVNNFAYQAKGLVTGANLESSFTSVREAAIFDQAGLDIAQYSSTAGQVNVTLTFNTPHGLIPGTPFILVDTAANIQTEEGPFFVNEVVDDLTIIYDSGQTQAGNTVNSGLFLYAVSNASFTHRPFDGGVELSSFYPIAGLEAKRQSRRYFRYQAGKSINFASGTLFCPSLDITSIFTDAAGIMSVTTERPHGFQAGVKVALSDIVSTGYNSPIDDYVYTPYTVTGVTDDDTFQIDIISEPLNSSLPNVSSITLNAAATLGISPKVTATNWTAGAVRSGMFDDANGMFWEYDGNELFAVIRSSTTQVTGTVTLTNNSNLVQGTGTRFGEQLTAGDKLFIKGQVYTIAAVRDANNVNINPAYRGVSTPAGSVDKISMVRETRVRSSDFNFDTLDGDGPSGYFLHPDRMQMLGIQWSWYGAGYVDFQCRGPLGDYITAHRMPHANFSTEAYMRTGNLPARYEIITGCRNLKTSTNTGTGTGPLSVTNASEFPSSGTIAIKSLDGGSVKTELIEYDGSNATQLGTNSVTRATSYSRFLAGSTRTFQGTGTPIDHPANSSIQLVSTNMAPQVSHWGSSVIMDGGFQEDKGFTFTASRFGISLGTGVTTGILLFRQAPAVSDTLVGLVGERELINRSRVELSTIALNNVNTAGSGSVEITGVLNPSNIDPLAVVWENANQEGYGGIQTGFQPTFAQYNLPTNPTSIADGEVLFKFICAENTNTFSLENVKELQNSILGGNGRYPNGPDLLAVVVSNKSPNTTVCDVVLTWKEAQA